MTYPLETIRRMGRKAHDAQCDPADFNPWALRTGTSHDRAYSREWVRGWAEAADRRRNQEHAALENRYDGRIPEEAYRALERKLSREKATILAALRRYQNELPLYPSDPLLDIASNGGAYAPLTPREIDELCIALN